MMDFDSVSQFIDEITPKPVWTGHALVVDAKNLIYRLAHREPDGTATAAVFIEKLMFLIDWYKVERLIVGWEGTGRNWRFKHLPEYKGHRDRTTDLTAKTEAAIKVLQPLLSMSSIEQATVKGAEGDDVFGTLAHQIAESGRTVAVYSTDRDLWQLATDKISIVVPMRGAPDMAVNGAEVEARVGVPPSSIPHLKGLQGDAGDNIPGVKGIGPKLALTLVKKHGTFPAVMAAAESMQRNEGETKAAYRRRLKLELGTTSAKLDAILRDRDVAWASFEAGKILRDSPVTMVPSRPATIREFEGELSRLAASRYTMERAHAFLSKAT